MMTSASKQEGLNFVEIIEHREHERTRDGADARFFGFTKAAKNC